MALYKEFTHPVLAPKVIKNGFSIPAFFGSWLFFFYHKCFKAGFLLIALNAGTFVIVKIIEKQSFQTYRENDTGYRLAIKTLDKLDDLENKGALDSLSQSQTLDYYNSRFDLLSQAGDNVRYSFDRKYKSIFIILDCILLIVAWVVFSSKQSKILEKTLLSSGYKLNFEAEAPNKAMFLAMASSSHDINEEPVKEKMNLTPVSVKVLKTTTNPVKKETQAVREFEPKEIDQPLEKETPVIKATQVDWQKQSSELLREAKEIETKQKEKKIGNGNSFDPPASI